MKRVLFAAVLIAAAGCAHGQVPPNPTAYSCPSVTASNYTPLGAAAGAVQTDSPAAGTYCYTAQSVNNTFSPPLQSAASAPTTPQTITAGQTVTLTVVPATGGVTPTGYIVSRAPAIAVTILAPSVK